MSTLAAQLLSAEVLMAAVARVADGHRDPDVGTVLRDQAPAVVRQIRAALVAGEVAFAPATRRVVLLDKARSLVDVHPLDRVVHTALGSLLARALEPQFDDGLLSYRAGRGRLQAVTRLRAVARADRLAHADIRARGLWVVRLDVASYGDSIPLTDDSELWSLLAAALPEEPAWLHSLLRAVVRCGAVGEFADRGVPSGSPVCNPLLNLYLADLDCALAPQLACYLRYGDDVVLVARSAALADAALAQAEAIAARKRLVFGAAKLQRLYWNGSGRTPTAPGWRGARTVPYVGLEVGYLDAPRIKTAKRRAVLAQVSCRLDAVARLLPVEPLSARVTALCTAARAMIDPRSKLVVPALAAFVQASSCRVQLGQMDQWMAAAIVRHATGVGGGRGFRQVSWRMLHDAGLPSLTALRNHGMRALEARP